MTIEIEKLIEIIVKEVIAELLKRGEVIDFSHEKLTIDNSNTELKLDVKRLAIDMSNYKTPLLTEGHLASLGSEIVEIVVPTNTIITPGAKEIIKKQKLILIKN